MRTHFSEQEKCVPDFVMADVSGRTVVAAVACIPPAVLCATSPVPAAPTDPVFAAIAAYERASAVAEAAGKRCDACYNVASRAEIDDLDRVWDQAFDEMQDALLSVARMSPTTIAGLSVWASFLTDRLNEWDWQDINEIPLPNVMDILTSVQRFAGVRPVTVSGRGTDVNGEG